MDKMANVTIDYIHPDEEYQHRVEAGYIVMGFVIGVFFLIILVLLFMARNEIKIQMKKLCQPAHQVQVESPKFPNSYQYLEGYNEDGVKVPYL